MNSQELLVLFQSRGLRAWQAAFAASFLEEGSAAFHLLAAPPGTGKMFASVAIAAELATQRVKRILVLPPASLCEAWRVRLGERQSQIPVSLVTRQVFREMEAALPVGQSPWDANGIYVISQDLAKQSDLAAGVSAVRWDLVIVDEAHRLAAPQRAALLDRLMAAAVIRRLLLLSATPLPSLEQWLHPSPDRQSLFSSPLAVTSWFGVLRNWDGSNVYRPPVNLKVILYTRGADEVQGLSRVFDLLKELELVSGGNSFLTEILTHRASSSPFAFEQSLRRLGHTLRSATKVAGVLPTEAAMAQSELPSTDEDVEPSDVDRGFAWNDKPAGASIIDQCLEALEMISADQKMSAVKRLIRSIVDTGHEDIPRICIVSRYADTLSYLRTAIDDMRLPVFKVTGAIRFTEREATVEQFLREGGVILGTDSGLLEDITMPQVTHVIHYDLPSNPSIFEQRRGRFDRFGRVTPLAMYVLLDESGAIPLESHLVDVVTSAQETAIDEAPPTIKG